MKRIKSAAIYQTLVFSQKEEAALAPEEALRLNQAEFEHYKLTLERTRTRHQITDVQQLADGSVLVHVRKQYNAKADVDEYFA